MKFVLYKANDMCIVYTVKLIIFIKQMTLHVYTGIIDNHVTLPKEDRSTEGCWKLKIRSYDKFRRDWSRN